LDGVYRRDASRLTAHRKAAIIGLLCIRPYESCCLPTSEDTNRKIHEAVDRVERELKQVIKYLNDEVVPTVRDESSKALRTAADQLTKLADYMDQAKRQP
jgi:hypothetical protein